MFKSPAKFQNQVQSILTKKRQSIHALELSFCINYKWKPLTHIHLVNLLLNPGTIDHRFQYMEWEMNITVVFLVFGIVTVLGLSVKTSGKPAN